MELLKSKQTIIKNYIDKKRLLILFLVRYNKSFLNILESFFSKKIIFILYKVINIYSNNYIIYFILWMICKYLLSLKKKEINK